MCHFWAQSLIVIVFCLFSHICRWQLHFIQSEFKGQLPQPYASGPQATQTIPANMNDQNLEEPSRYVSGSDTHTRRLVFFSVSNCGRVFILNLFYFCHGQVDLRQCHYLVDLDTDEETPLEPRYSANKEEWTVIAYKPFLQASRYFPQFMICPGYEMICSVPAFNLAFFLSDPPLSSEPSTSRLYRSITPPTGATSS